MSCGWPFHNDPDCQECKQWEDRYSQNLDDWLAVKAEVQEAARVARAARRKTTKRTPNA